MVAWTGTLIYLTSGPDYDGWRELNNQELAVLRVLGVKERLTNPTRSKVSSHQSLLAVALAPTHPLAS